MVRVLPSLEDRERIAGAFGVGRTLSPRGRAFASLLLYFHFCLIFLKECFMEYKSLRKLYFSSIVKFLKVYFCLRQGIGVHLALRWWVCVAMANWILYL